MSEPDIRRETTGNKGRYVLETGHGAAEMTWSVMSPHRVIVDHTAVPDAARGQGHADALALRAVTDARAEGVTITPLCPFLRGWAQRHPEWADVFA